MKHRQKPPPQELPGDRHGRPVSSTDYVRELADCLVRADFSSAAYRPAFECIDAPEILAAGSLFQIATGQGFAGRLRYWRRA